MSGSGDFQLSRGSSRMPSGAGQITHSLLSPQKCSGCVQGDKGVALEGVPQGSSYSSYTAAVPPAHQFRFNPQVLAGIPHIGLPWVEKTGHGVILS